MARSKYQRSIEELNEVASKFWPAELSEKEAELSIIPLLLETQDQFISILNVEVDTLDKIFDLIDTAKMPANLFVKHLVILADFGGEMLKRISNEFKTLFPEGKLNYYWQGEEQTYTFKALPDSKLNNVTLQIDGKKLIEKHDLSAAHKDAITLLLFGSLHSDDDNNDVAATLAKCEIGEYLGQPDKLETFIKQRYIWVSRITGGAKANSLGQIAQQFVAQYITENISQKDIKVQSNGHLPDVTHTDEVTGRLTTFDLVVTNNKKYVAVEVSFQVTTNSTIERKAGQAKARYEQAKAAGHNIAYVIDGAGNFERENAIKTICSYSHCTVAFSHAELAVLCDFLNNYFKS